MASTPLHDAVKQGNKTLVKKLLEKGDSIGTVNSDGNTSLHLAFLEKQEQIIDIILDHIKKTSNYTNFKNNQGITHLHIACTRQDKDIIEGFVRQIHIPIDKNSSLWPGCTPLDLAIEFKSLESAQYLARAIKLKGFADEEQKNILHKNNPGFPLFHPMFLHLYHSYAVKDEVPSCNILLPFHYVCSHDNPERVKVMIQSGAVVNEPMSPDAQYCGLYTPLHVAIEAGSKGNVQVLLDSGADPHRCTLHYMTALHLAFYTDDYRAKDTIVDRIYNVVKNKEADLMDIHGLTYFHIACSRNDVPLVKKLLDQGADVNRKIMKNVRSYSNFTPLHFAVLYRREEMVKLLIERGAEVDFFDVKTPLYLACFVGHHDIIEFLLNHDANPTITHPESFKTVLHVLAEHIIDNDWAYFYNDDMDDDYSDDTRKKFLADFIEPMVKAGVDVNKQDVNGYTALHYACLNIYEASIFSDVLIKWGADVNLENDDGQTPLELLMEGKYKSNPQHYLDFYYHVQRLRALGIQINPKNEECCKEIIDLSKVWEVCDWLYSFSAEPQAIQKPKKE